MGRVRTAINLRQANATDYEAKLRMSYRSIAETVPRQIMAEALLAAFRSSDLGLAKLVEESTPVLVAGLAGMVRFSQREGPTCLDPEI